MTSMIELMRLTACEHDAVTCRLQLLEGIRCPKWHEDHVKLRLIKTYCGQGTDWVDPDDKVIRAANALRSQMDWDLKVDDESKINQASAGDVLIITGRKREIVNDGKTINPVPVLHRSPLVNKNSRRLLFTVTVTTRAT